MNAVGSSFYAATSVPAMLCIANTFASSAAIGFATCLQGYAFDRTQTSNFNFYKSCKPFSPKLLCTNADEAMHRMGAVGLSCRAFPRVLAATAALGITATWTPNLFGQPNSESNGELISPMWKTSFLLLGILLAAVLAALLDGRSSSKETTHLNSPDDDVSA